MTGTHNCPYSREKIKFRRWGHPKLWKKPQGFGKTKNVWQKSVEKSLHGTMHFNHASTVSTLGWPKYVMAVYLNLSVVLGSLSLYCDCQSSSTGNVTHQAHPRFRFWKKISIKLWKMRKKILSYFFDHLLWHGLLSAEVSFIPPCLAKRGHHFFFGWPFRGHQTLPQL